MYDRTLALQYAKRWAFDFNPEYYNFSAIGGDCTNFVSQCLFAGNIKMNYNANGWFYNSLNDRAPAWTGVDEFWDFGTFNKNKGPKLTECKLYELQVGDIIQLSNGERFYHTLFVVDTTGDIIKVSAHDTPSFNLPLTAYYFKNYRCAIVSD